MCFIFIIEQCAPTTEIRLRGGTISHPAPSIGLGVNELAVVIHPPAAPAVGGHDHPLAVPQIVAPRAAVRVAPLVRDHAPTVPSVVGEVPDVPPPPPPTVRERARPVVHVPPPRAAVHVAVGVYHAPHAVLGVHVPLAGVDAQIPGVPAYPVALPRAVARELPGVPAPVGVGREPRAVRGAPGDGASATATARVAASALVAVVVLAVFGGVGSLLFGPETTREQRRRLLPNGGGHGDPARYPREHV